ncbi:hypothetical protein [Paenibacillus sp. FSL R5-0470]|uniref:hypothetical protein n=1 Tax=Paenibacillus sp. FSL R5-0470 TaxID=2921641 RepID=UPI0030DAC37E
MKSVHNVDRQIKCKKVTAILFVLILLACVLPGPQYAGAEAAVGTTKDKIRHETQFLFAGNMDKITVRTVKTSFDTGERKANEYYFTDPAYLPKPANGDDFDSFINKASLVNSPTGLKAYAILEQYGGAAKEVVRTLYEYDYNSFSLRKVVESKSPIILHEYIGLYVIYTYFEKPNQYYSLADNKLISTGGEVIRPEDVENSNYTLSPQPKTQDYTVFCPKSDLKGCYLMQYGGGKGAAVKVTLNHRKGDSSGMDGDRVITVDSTKITLQSKFIKYLSYKWNIKGTVNGKSKVLFDNTATDARTYISPNHKYLLLITDQGTLNGYSSSVVHIYNLKTLELVRKYDSQYKSNVTAVTWASDEIFIIEYYFSNPSKYPPSFYYIPAGISLQIPYMDYRDWKEHKSWDNFTYEKMIFPALPVAIRSGNAMVNYQSQPAFLLKGQYYVPLKEFAAAFHIQYAIGAKEITFTRGSRSAAVTLQGSGIVRAGFNDFLPLGSWNKALGLKVIDGRITLSDEEQASGLGLSQEVYDPQAVVVNVNTSDRVDDIVLNPNKTLSLVLWNYT